MTRAGRPSSRKHLDPVADLHHDAAVRGEDARALARFRAGGGIDPHQGDRLADGLLHQRGGRQQVEVEILLDDADAVARQGHGLGPDLRRDVGEFLTERPAGRSSSRLS